MEYEQTPRRSLLLVEDDPEVAWVFRTTLETRFDVYTARDLSTARAFLRASHPTLVVLDLQLQDGDGLAFCRDVKKIDPRLRVLVVSANRHARREALASGADGFLAKPAELDHIEALADQLAP